MVPKKSVLGVEISSGNMRDSLFKCLVEADSYQMHSISFPAIGTGHLRKTGKESADIMCNAIADYVKRAAKRSIKDIRIVILDETVLREFQKHFLERINASFGSVPVTVDNKVETCKRTQKRVIIDIATEDPKQMDESKQDLSKIAKERSRSENVEDDTIMELPEKYLSEIQELQHRYCVKIEARPQLGFLRITGLSENVANAKAAIHQKLRAYEKEKSKATLTSQHVQWLYYDDGGDESSEPEEVIPLGYGEKISAEIEAAYKSNYQTVDVGDHQRLRIDFRSKPMVEIDLDTNETRKVYRSSREG